MPQQLGLSQAYDSDANVEPRTDDEADHQEPSPTKEQKRVSAHCETGCIDAESRALNNVTVASDRCQIPPRSTLFSVRYRSTKSDLSESELYQLLC